MYEHVGNCTWSGLLGGGFKRFLFSPLPGEMIQCDEHIFQMALKPPSLFFNGSFWLPVD